MSNKNEKEGNKKEEDNRKEAILINKMYTGSYLSNSNTGHETINFLEADDGSKYIYITPYGNYNNEDYKIKYVLLTGPQINKQYQIIAMIKFDNANNKNNNKNNDIEDNTEDYSYHNLAIKLDPQYAKHQKISKKVLKEIHDIQAQNLKYGGQYLYDIFKNKKGNDTEIYATFKVNKIYEPKDDKDIIVRLNDGEKGIYINGKKIDSIDLTLGRRGIRYITTEDEKNNKNSLTKLIEDSSLWKDYTPKKVTIENLSDIKGHFNFINLINGENNEYAYSSMLAYYFCLEFNGRLLFQEFYNKKFRNKNMEFLNVFQEHYLPNRSRPDIVFDGKNENEQVIIENKIKSGINGNQLTKYKKGLIFVPNYNEDLIKNDPEFIKVKSNFKIITYRELLDFFDNNQVVSKYIKTDKIEERYFEDFKSALRIQSRDKGEIEIDKFNHLLSKTKENNYQVYVLKILTNNKKLKYKYFVGVSNNFIAHKEEIKKFFNSKDIKPIDSITLYNNLQEAFNLKESIEKKLTKDLNENDLQEIIITSIQELNDQSINSNENKD